MPKYGAQSIFYYVGGRNLMGAKPKSIEYAIQAEHEEATGVGDTVMQTLPTGVTGISFEQSGAFFDTTNTHTYLSDVADSPQETLEVIVAGFGGDTVGQPMVGFDGAFKASYKALSQTAKLTKANTKFEFSGNCDQGVILKATAAITVDTNGTSVDNAAATTSGGAAYLHVTAFSGFSAAVVTVEHSSDNSSWTTKGTFTTVSSAPTAERIALAGTINRYTRYAVDVTGSGSITFGVGIKRN